MFKLKSKFRSDGAGRRLRLAAEMAGVGVLVVLAYSNHFHNSFHFDDAHTIVNNGAIRDVRNVPRFFADATTFSALPTNQSYRPVLSTLLAIDYWMGGGLDPFWFQLSGFVYFAGVVVALGLVIRGMLDAHEARPGNAEVAVAAAGIYALHPANADTVNYIIAQGDVISTLAVLVSLAWAQRSAGARRSGLCALPAAGVLAKPPAAMFAPLYAVYAWLFEAENTGRWFRVGVAFALCGAATGFVSHMTPRHWVGGAASTSGYLLTQPYVALLYFKTFFWPAGLSADYDLAPFATWHDARCVAGFLFMLGLFVATGFCVVRRRLRVVGFGLSWFIIALLPTSLMPLAEVMNDHRTFFPYAGLAMAMAGVGQLVWLGLARGSSAAGRMGVSGAVVAIWMVGAAATYQRNEVWKDEASLWLDVTMKSPRNGRGLMNYGNTLMARGDYAGALDYFHRALVFAPNYPVLYVNLGVAEGATGKAAQAERDFRQGLALAPENPDCHTYYARWLMDRGRRPEAVSLLEEALALSPGDVTAQGLLARARGGGGGMAQTAEGWLRMSLQAYLKRDYPGSIRFAQEALKLRPGYAEAWNNIGAAYNSMGRYGEAIMALREAVRLKPDLALARNNLRWAEEKLMGK